MSLIDRIVQAPLGDDPPSARLLYGQDVRKSLRLLPDNSVHMVATSPPYWGLRDYGGEKGVWGGDPDCEHEWGEEGPPHHPGQVEQTKWKGAEAAGKGQTAGSGQLCSKCGAWLGQLGLEPTPEMFIEHLVEVCDEVQRVLRPDGTLWVNLGDSYIGGGGFYPDSPSNQNGSKQTSVGGTAKTNRTVTPYREQGGFKKKDLAGIPWMFAFALRDAGWYLRSDLIWSKGNPMPESVRDRPTKAHEYVFLFAHPDSKGKYFYDQDAIREPSTGQTGAAASFKRSTKEAWVPGQAALQHREDREDCEDTGTRNKRSVWNVNTKPYPGAHFAVWPEALVEPMVKAGSSEHGVCSECGAPWKRSKVKKPVEGKEGVSTGGDPSRKDGGARVSDPSGGGGNVLARKTFAGAWQPTCECDAGEPVRATVMDIFSGSATTGAVAMRLGRNYIGTDLQPDYFDLAESRLRGRKAPKKGGKADDTPDLLSDLFGG